MFFPMFFLICNLGEMVTSAFADLNETVYGIAWPLCPIELQKNLVMMLPSTQKSVIMRGIFSLDCSRSTFKQVNCAYGISSNLSDSS